MISCKNIFLTYVSHQTDDRSMMNKTINKGAICNFFLCLLMSILSNQNISAQNYEVSDIYKLLQEVDNVSTTNMLPENRLDNFLNKRKYRQSNEIDTCKYLVDFYDEENDTIINKGLHYDWDVKEVTYTPDYLEKIVEKSVVNDNPIDASNLFRFSKTNYTYSSSEKYVIVSETKETQLYSIRKSDSMLLRTDFFTTHYYYGIDSLLYIKEEYNINLQNHYSEMTTTQYAYECKNTSMYVKSIHIERRLPSQGSAPISYEHVDYQLQSNHLGSDNRFIKLSHRGILDYKAISPTGTFDTVNRRIDTLLITCLNHKKGIYEYSQNNTDVGKQDALLTKRLEYGNSNSFTYHARSKRYNLTLSKKGNNTNAKLIVVMSSKDSDNAIRYLYNYYQNGSEISIHSSPINIDNYLPKYTKRNFTYSKKIVKKYY